MKILDYNECKYENCNCGWNILISGKDKQELRELKKALADLDCEVEIIGEAYGNV